MSPRNLSRWFSPLLLMSVVPFSSPEFDTRRAPACSMFRLPYAIEVDGGGTYEPELLHTAGFTVDVPPSLDPSKLATTKADDGFGPKFRRAWIPITVGELALLGITASLPKSWTGWSSHFVADGANHLERAWTQPPVIDTDRWYHNYIGHPYGGSLYYNSVRSQGATPRQSFFMSVVLSTQWEYVFEAVAERPSIQDLIITPIVGSALGEVVHRTTVNMTRNGTSFPEKVFITVANPMHAIFHGYGPSPEPSPATDPSRR